jgi:hypothetical protein
MRRAVRFSEIRKASPAAREKMLAGIAAAAKAPANGQLAELDAEIAEFEERYGISSDHLLEELSEGKREETMEIVTWLMRIRLRERIGPLRTG